MMVREGKVVGCFEMEADDARLWKLLFQRDDERGEERLACKWATDHLSGLAVYEKHYVIELPISCKYSEIDDCSGSL